jgi:tetratricopeptide (TPR) repeat protein
MGVALQQSNDLEHSIPYLEQAIKLKPELTQARYRLARAYWKMGRRKDGEVQMELQKKYARQEAEDLDRSLSQIVTFGVEVKQ